MHNSPEDPTPTPLPGGRLTVPKIVGGDVELANFIVGSGVTGPTGDQASRLLLSAIDGIDSGVRAPAQALDWGRKFLPGNSACCYIDSQHLEVCIPEVRSAFDYVAYGRAMFFVAREATRRVNAELGASLRLHVLANCSDGLGNSYGSHVNVLLTRDAWNDIFHRRTHYLAYLASFQISSIVITGQGKVGVERDRPAADFQLSQRADFIETTASFDTMVHRGVVNSRDESHCIGSAKAAVPPLARLHVIFYDNTLAQVATVLRAGMLQMVVAMIEAGFVNAALALDDPLDALTRYSRDPGLGASARLVDGRRRTAVELQRDFYAEARLFADQGGFDGIVPDATKLLGLWDDTLTLLERRDFDTLSRRLDWVLKRRLLEGVLERRPDLSWQSPTLKYLDQMYASLDEQDGLFWPLEAAGKVDRVVDDDAIARAMTNPPADTRAWTRAALLRLAGPSGIEQVDWHRVRVRLPSARGTHVRLRTIFLPVPYADTRAENVQHFGSGAPLSVVAEELRATEEWPTASMSVITPDYWTVRQGGLQ